MSTSSLHEQDSPPQATNFCDITPFIKATINKLPHWMFPSDLDTWMESFDDGADNWSEVKASKE